MYTIERKKRKFDRILETIKDNPNPRLPLTTSSPIGNTTHSSAGMNSAKRRRVGASIISSKAVSVPSPAKTASYLPASREAFLERLETFRLITKWHVSSTEDISAVAWAKRGWSCADTDMVACKTCNEHLLIKLDLDEEATATTSAEIDDEKEEGDISSPAALRHRLLVERYRDMIITSHAHSCPWRNRGCDDSIQRISGLFNSGRTLQTLKARYDSLRSFEIPSVHLPSEEFSYPIKEILQFRFDADQTEELHQDTLMLAMCGWQASPGREDVAECRACFRSLGLWLYRGKQPIMEKLDATESHLEYCPWRSASAQGTVIESEGRKRMVPASMLIARMIKEVTRRSPVDGATEKQHEKPEELGEKERETKVKELLRRVKELKKPFNVKALLRKKPGAG